MFFIGEPGDGGCCCSHELLMFLDKIIQHPPERVLEVWLLALDRAAVPVAVRAGPVAGFGARCLDSAGPGQSDFLSLAVPDWGAPPVNVAGAGPLGKLLKLVAVTGGPN